MDKTDELLAILEKTIETEETILSEEEIEQATNSKDYYLRERITEVLAFYPIDFARKILLKLLYDPIKNVRSSAAIDLGAGYYGVEAMEALIDRLCNDNDSLTRGWSASILAEVYSKNSEEDAERIFRQLEIVAVKDKSYFVKANCYGGLYAIEPKETYLNSLFDCYKSKNYRTRCAVVNIFMTLVRRENAETIINYTEKMLKRESAYSVISTITKLIGCCNQFLM